MTAAVRLGDLCTGHGDWPPRPNNSASANVFINNKGAHRLTDSWAVHCNATPSCHSATQVEGSSNVFINNLNIARVGDMISCGSAASEGSPNVFIN